MGTLLSDEDGYYFSVCRFSDKEYFTIILDKKFYKTEQEAEVEYLRAINEKFKSLMMK